MGQMREELGPLWRIAWPLFIAQTAQIGTGVVDTVDGWELWRYGPRCNRHRFQYLATLCLLFSARSSRAQRSLRKTSVPVGSGKSVTFCCRGYGSWQL